MALVANHRNARAAACAALYRRIAAHQHNGGVNALSSAQRRVSPKRSAACA
jgi:hypothetical protein